MANEQRVYRVPRVAKKDAIDWSTVPKAPIDQYGWVPCKTFVAWGQLVFAEDFGFVCKLTCEEEYPFAECTEMDGPVWNESCLEFFVKFGPEGYLNLEGNSIGNVCMQFGPTNRERALVKYTLPGGFGHVAEVQPGQWTVTYSLAIPQIRLFYPNVDFATFAPGFEFTGNFYKTGSKEKTGNEHYGMWNEVKVPSPSFHQPEWFGKLIMG